jgi:catechol 2,3-dioxygenase-like lactoylglutathione lyase family enzyme
MLISNAFLVYKDATRNYAVTATNYGEFVMTIQLNHTIVPAQNKIASAQFFGRIFGLEFDPNATSHFAAVQVNDSLTLDFANSKEFESHHYAFKVSEAEFNAIFARIHAQGVAYGSGPHHLTDGDINHRGGGRGMYFQDPNGHVLELLTTD